MKFENRGKWLKEAEDKLAAYDTQEHPDFLDGDNKVCTFEDDEITNFEEDDLDVVEEDDTLDSPEDEEMDLAMEAAMPPMGQRKRIEFEDDIVRVYDGNKEIYAGAEDYEPMQDEDWKWDNANKYYKFDKYIKVCCESSQKNESRTIDDIPTRDLGKCLKAYRAKTKDMKLLNSTAIAKEFQKVFNLDYAPSVLMVDKIIDNMPKEYTEAKFKSTSESSQKNEDNASELKKELNDLYRGIGWAEWDYFKEGLAYSTNFKPGGMSDNDLEKMINASGIAKVKKVREIRNYSSMEDFDPKDFRPDDKIIVTKKPMSSQFHGESLQKNEGSNWEYSVSVLDNYGDIQYSTSCNSQSDIDNAIKKYKARSVELRNADNCRTIEVTKDLVDDDGNILKTQSIKKISL